MADPFAPLGHHWQDSTHIAFGVLTAGFFTKFAKLEGSWFNGREPDANRWDFDLRRPDSYSGRLSVNPSKDWSFQISAGHLRSPETLEPDTSVTRITASVTYNRSIGSDGNWASTASWGRNKPEGETATNSFLLETNLEVDAHHEPFARVEYLRKLGSELVLGPPLEERTFGITSVTLGYVYDFDPLGPVMPGLGFSVSVDFLDRDLESAYGHKTTYGFMVFLRLWPTKMKMDKAGEGHDMHH